MSESPPNAYCVKGGATVILLKRALLNRLGVFVKLVIPGFLTEHLGKQAVGPRNLPGLVRLHQGPRQMLGLVPL